MGASFGGGYTPPTGNKKYYDLGDLKTLDDYLGDPFVSAKTIFSLTTPHQKVYTLVPYANASASSKVVYQEIQFKEPSTSFLGKTANSIIYLGNKYDEWKSKYQFIGSMEDMLKTVYHYGGTAIAFGAAPVLTGSIAILTTAYPEQTEQALNYIKDTFQKGLSFIDSDLNQRQLDTLTTTAKVTFDTALLKQMAPHAAQNFKNLSSAAGKLLNPSKVKVFDIGRMPKDAIIIDISDPIYLVKPLKSEPPSMLFSEMTSVKAPNTKLIEYKAPVGTKSQAITDLPVNELSIIQKADQQGGGFKFKKSIYIFSQNTLDHTLNITRNISTPKEEAMAIIRNNPQIFQVPSDYSVPGSSHASDISFAAISSEKTFVKYDSPTDITKSWIFKLEGSDSKYKDFARPSVLGKGSLPKDKSATKNSVPRELKADEEFANKAFKELHEKIYKDFSNRWEKAGLPTDSVSPHTLKGFVEKRLRTNFKDYNIDLKNPESIVSNYIKNKIELEVLSDWGRLRVGQDNTTSSINANDALKDLQGGLLSKEHTERSVLSDGTIRLAKPFEPARTSGPTAGSKNIIEYNPNTGGYKCYTECYNHNGEVVRTRLQNLNGQEVISDHTPKTGAEIESLKGKK